MNKYIDFLYKVTYPNQFISGAKIGVCIVYKKRIISYGFNQKKTHTLQVKYRDKPQRIYLHGEIDAIIKSLYFLTPKQLAKSTMYVIRIMKNGKLGLSKPCTGCQKALENFGINKVTYTIDNYKVGNL